MPAGPRSVLVFAAALGIAACASGPRPPPYPAFVDVGAIPEQFMATLPGIRARQFAGDPETGTSATRIDLPAGWEGTTGGAAGKSVEIFVLAGTLELADIELGPGGYAYVPPGSLGFNLYSPGGARLLWFSDDVDRNAMIRTPIILDSGLVEWQPGPFPGTWVRELRADPGSGARTWLWRVEPAAALPFRQAAAKREGYLVEGSFRESECVAGEAYTDSYAPGGYFSRPGGAVYGGPASGAVTESVWLMRQAVEAAESTVAGCSP